MPTELCSVDANRFACALRWRSAVELATILAATTAPWEPPAECAASQHRDRKARGPAPSSAVGEVYSSSGLAALAVAAAVTAVWVMHLDRVVTREFKAGTGPCLRMSMPHRSSSTSRPRWQRTISKKNCIAIHYRRGDLAAGPGVYRRTGGAFELQARRVRFIDELREPERVFDQRRWQFDHGLAAGERRRFARVPPRPAGGRQRVSHSRRGPSGLVARRRAALC